MLKTIGYRSLNTCLPRRWWRRRAILFLFDARFIDLLPVCHCQWQNAIELFSVGVNSLVTCLSFLVNHVFKLPVVRTTRLIFRGQFWHPAADVTANYYLQHLNKIIDWSKYHWQNRVGRLWCGSVHHSKGPQVVYILGSCPVWEADATRVSSVRSFGTRTLVLL